MTDTRQHGNARLADQAAEASGVIRGDEAILGAHQDQRRRLDASETTGRRTGEDRRASLPLLLAAAAPAESIRDVGVGCDVVRRIVVSGDFRSGVGQAGAQGSKLREHVRIDR
jgi:hypothetical protein